MLRLVLSDLDGTLMTDDNRIRQQDVRAVKELGRHGIAFGFVTGRDVSFCRQLAVRYELTLDVLIADNGASLIYEGEYIARHEIPVSKALTALELLRALPDRIYPFFCAQNGFFYRLKREAAALKEPVPYPPTAVFAKEDAEEYLLNSGAGVAKLSIIVESIKERDRLLPLLQKQLPDLEVSATSWNYIELTEKKVDKGRTLQELMRKKGYGREEIAVIADGHNDIAMFPHIAGSYVMEHAPLEVRRLGRYQVTSVAQAIEELLKNDRHI